MYDIVKVRVSGGCVIITIPRRILKLTTIRDGDGIIITATSPETISLVKAPAYAKKAG